MNNVIETIKELYEWAVENGVENTSVYVLDDDNERSICKSEICIKENEIWL